MGAVTAASACAEEIVDYRSYDYRAVWEHLGRVDRFDRVILARMLGQADPGRILELGTGFGRLAPELLRSAREYVGVDYNPAGVAEALRAGTAGGTASRRLWIAANAYHLPFANGSFTTVCMIRVHHHLGEPELALREVARVLVPGGTAIVTYNTRSRWRTLLLAATDSREAPGRPQDRPTGGPDPSGHVLVRERPLRHFATERAEFQREVASSGLMEQESLGEPQVRASRLLPLGLGVWLGRTWPGAPLFSTRWSVLRKPGPPTSPVPWARILACPACGASPPGWTPQLAGRICDCGFRVTQTDGIVDLRFVPSEGSFPAAGLAGRRGSG